MPVYLDVCYPIPSRLILIITCTEFSYQLDDVSPAFGPDIDGSANAGQLHDFRDRLTSNHMNVDCRPIVNLQWLPLYDTLSPLCLYNTLFFCFSVTTGLTASFIHHTDSITNGGSNMFQRGNILHLLVHSPKSQMSFLSSSVGQNRAWCHPMSITHGQMHWSCQCPSNFRPTQQWWPKVNLLGDYPPHQHWVCCWIACMLQYLIHIE